MPTNKWLVQFELTDTYETIGDTAYEAFTQEQILEMLECGGINDLEGGIEIGPITVTKQEDIQTNDQENKQ
jgi:hypothetical protein